ncbi:hypothetical protein DENSPDRAFT_838550 [Dentipellis sp. KUC8613]|nr:hypothetical protein DENSPDRAFT_838550 [Dentipellis sp. KUC8613]
MSDLATSVHRLYAVKYVQVASMTLLVYDTAVLMDQEVELIWSTKVNVVQIFYFISRYSPYLDTVLNIYDYLAPNPNPRTCYITYSIGSVLTAVGIAFSEMILIIRTYALFKRSRKFLYIFGPLWIAACSIAVWSVSDFVKSIVFERRPEPQIPGCYMAVVSPIVFVCFATLLIIETIIVICTIWKGVTLLREVKSSPFMRAFYRDSILFYFAIFPLTIGNVVVFLTAPTELLDLFDTLTRVFHSLLCCRIILHLRAAGHGPITTPYVAPNSTVYTLTRPVECDFSMWDDAPEDQDRPSYAAREIEMVDRENG